MSTIPATLASWSTFKKSDGGFIGAVTKDNMRSGLKLAPRKVEFCAIPTPVSRGGYFFIDEVAGQDIELRYGPNGTKVMLITVSDDGQSVIVR